MAYEIILSPEALDHLAALTARQRRIVLNAIETRLSISQPPQQGGVSLCDLTRWRPGSCGLVSSVYTTK